MPTETDTALSQLLGPYENWAFGSGGSKHGGMKQAGKAAFQVAGITEIRPARPVPGIAVDIFSLQNKGPAPPALAAAAADALHTPKGMVYPSLWQKGIEKTGPSGTHIWPCVLMFPAKASRTSSADDIAAYLLKLKDSTVLWGINPPAAKPEFGYRLNWLMPPSNFDTDFAKSMQRPQPALTAEGTILEKIGKIEGNTAPLAIIAVIDDGIPFAHANLMDKAGLPRTEFCWLQSADAAAGGTVLFGREHTRSTIEALVSKNGGDEDALYREAGAVQMNGNTAQPLAHLWTHGAHVLDIAAGHNHADVIQKRMVDSADGNLDRVRLIGVELPSPMIIDTVGFGKDAFILSAFHYIFDRADRIAEMYGLDPAQVPLIINFSFGFTGGPHDGSDRIEEAIAHLIKTRQSLGGETKLVMPSGNDFHSALYGEIRKSDLDQDSQYSIPWRIQPNDRTPSYLEVWYPLNIDGKPVPKPPVPIIQTPSGNAIELAEPRSDPLEAQNGLNQQVWDLIVDKKNVGQVSIDLYRGIRWRLLVVLGPTDEGPLSSKVGLWTITIGGSPLATIPDIQAPVIACRIQRDNGMRHPAQGGRQSYFDHRSDRHFNDDGSLQQDDTEAVFVRRFGTLNGLATHDTVIVVGGSVKDSGKAATYSSAGKNDAIGAAVSCSAPSDDTALMPGQLAAGTRAFAVSRLVGTSAAAPQVARGIALAFLDNTIGTSLKDGTRIKGLREVAHTVTFKTSMTCRLGEGIVVE